MIPARARPYPAQREGAQQASTGKRPAIVRVSLLANSMAFYLAMAGLADLAVNGEPEADMPTTNHDDIELVAGDAWHIVGTLLDKGGNRLDLTNASIAGHCSIRAARQLE